MTLYSSGSPSPHWNDTSAPTHEPNPSTVAVNGVPAMPAFGSRLRSGGTSGATTLNGLRSDPPPSCPHVANTQCPPGSASFGTSKFAVTAFVAASLVVDAPDPISSWPSHRKEIVPHAPNPNAVAENESPGAPSSALSLSPRRTRCVRSDVDDSVGLVDGSVPAVVSVMTGADDEGTGVGGVVDGSANATPPVSVANAIAQAVASGPTMAPQDLGAAPVDSGLINAASRLVTAVS
jgi:hypothetical protein